MNKTNSINSLSRLILQTKYGGVPFLNDYLISLFNSNFFNIKFTELLNYLDIFEKYNDHINNLNKNEDKSLTHSDTKLLSKYFKLEYSYLSFMDSNNITKVIGSSNDDLYLLQTNTGTTKVTNQEYIKYLNIFNSELSEVPYEFIPEDCGKKRVLRCYKKMTEFFKQFNSSQAIYNHNIKLILPIFMYHLDLIPQEELKKLIENNEKFISGFLIITENYKILNIEKILKYRNFIHSQIKGEAFIKFGQGHPSNC